MYLGGLRNGSIDDTIKRAVEILRDELGEEATVCGGQL